MQTTSPPYNRYWIHGPKASGKTFLSRLIAGSDASAILTHGSTVAGIRRLLQSAKNIIVEEFDESGSNCIRSLIAASRNGIEITGTTTENEPVTTNYDIDVLVVVSFNPPQDAVLRTCFHFVGINNMNPLTGGIPRSTNVVEETPSPSEHSFCYEVRENLGLGAEDVARFIAKNWADHGYGGPIPILAGGGGHWVVKHLESIDKPVSKIDMNQSGPGKRFGSGPGYHLLFMEKPVSAEPEPLPELHAGLTYPADAKKISILCDKLESAIYSLGSDDDDEDTVKTRFEQLRRFAREKDVSDFELVECIQAFRRIPKIDHEELIRLVRNSLAAAKAAEIASAEASSQEQDPLPDLDERLKRAAAATARIHRSLVGIRITESQADELCKQIRSRGTLPES